MATPQYPVIINSAGHEKPGHHTIFPICKQLPTSEIEVVGTGFFITHNGIFITADHVLEDVIDFRRNQIAHVFLFQFSTDGKYILRPLLRKSGHGVSDIAVGCAAPMKSDSTGESLENDMLSLTLNSPQRGELSSVFAYPHTKIQRKDNEKYDLFFKPSRHNGHYEEFVPDASKVSGKLKGPCFRISVELPGATSGGPVFGPNGRVYGIVSTNYDGTDISLVTRIQEILKIQLEDISIPGFERKEFLIEELVSFGYISLT